MTKVKERDHSQLPYSREFFFSKEKARVVDVNVV